MFENLSKEIILLSMVPVVLIFISDLIAFLVLRKERKKNYRFNYFIKISIIIAIAFVLPLIVGYTIWVIESFNARNILHVNILYILLLIFLCICLLVLLIWIYLKTKRYIKLNEKDDEEKEESY